MTIANTLMAISYAKANVLRVLAGALTPDTLVEVINDVRADTGFGTIHEEIVKALRYQLVTLVGEAEAARVLGEEAKAQETRSWAFAMRTLQTCIERRSYFEIMDEKSADELAVGEGWHVHDRREGGAGVVVSSLEALKDLIACGPEWYLNSHWNGMAKKPERAMR